MLQGEKVTGNIGNDLNIESKQDSNSYKDSSKSVGASVGIGSGSVNSSKIDSNYKSVTAQSSVYAGESGFDIGVGKNTGLKGGIISSEKKDNNFYKRRYKKYFNLNFTKKHRNYSRAFCFSGRILI